MKMCSISALVVFILLVLTLTLNSSEAQPTSEIDRSTLSASLGSELIPISEVGGNDDSYPAVAYNSILHEYMVVWEVVNIALDDTHIMGARVSETGQVLSRFVVADYENLDMWPAIAYDSRNNRYLLVWMYSADGEGDFDIYGRILNWDGSDSGYPTINICSITDPSWFPQVVYAYEQNEYLVVWMDNVTNSPISGRRVNPDGTYPANSYLTISSGPGNRMHPHVSYNLHRNEYLVVWDYGYSSIRGDNIYGVRLRGDGMILGSGEFLIAGWPAEEFDPVVAACHQADQFLVAWVSDQDTGGSDYAIYARYLNGDANPGNVYLIADEDDSEWNVDINCDARGEKYYLLWEDAEAAGCGNITGRMAFSNETFGEIQGITTDCVYNHTRSEPATAGGRTTFLTAWMHEWKDIHSGNIYFDIKGRLIGSFLYLPIILR